MKARRVTSRRAAVLAARTGAWLSRRGGFGDGTAIGGRLGLRIAPDLMTTLSADTRVALVSATNGKSTVSTMLAAALRTRGEVAFNDGGSNMSTGIVMALAAAPSAGTAVLEVDEIVLGDIASRTSPAVVVLMNLSREYTRGVSLQRVVQHWRRTLADPAHHFTLVANADDPLIVHVAEPLADEPVVWVAGGSTWRRDSPVCPRCGSDVSRAEPPGTAWACTGCALRRPEPDWSIEDGAVRGPGGSAPLAVSMPGRWLLSNAAFAMAAADVLGVPADASARAIGGLDDVGGRYRPVDVQGRQVRLYLVKNPASWAEAVTLADLGEPVVLAMESFSIKDLVPPWDVDIAGLGSAPQLVATGQRRHDVAVLLETAGLACTLVADPVDAVLSLPPGPVHIIVNYTAFQDLRKRL